MKSKLAVNGGQRAISQSLVNRLPVWPPVYPETAELIKQVYLSGQWSFNEIYEKRFSQRFAAHHSAQFGVFMVNGTVTLECALEALGIGAGDEVIVPALTWIATAMAVCYDRAVPVFVDIEPDTLCLDPQKVEKAITKKTKAIIPVHIYGSMADMEAIMDVADKHGIPVIEDCAHAHGGIWSGRGVGSSGHIGSFSFQQSKTLPSGEGGICLTNDSKLAETLFRLKHIGYDSMSGQGKAASSPPEGLICHNYRATEFQAVILLESLKYLQAQTELRDKNAKYLGTLIADIPGVKIQSRGRLADLQGYYTLVLLVNPSAVNNMALDDIIKSLQAEGLVGAGRTYGPVYKHLLWNIPANMYRIDGDGCPVCEDICDHKAVCINHSWLLADDKEIIEAVSRAIKKVVNSIERE